MVSVFEADESPRKSDANGAIAELPEYQAGAGYRVLETLLGRVPNLGTVGDFSTQSGDFTGTGEMATGSAQGPL